MTSAQKTRNVLQNKQKQKFPPTHPPSPPLKKKKNHAMYMLTKYGYVTRTIDNIPFQYKHNFLKNFLSFYSHWME